MLRKVDKKSVSVAGILQLGVIAFAGFLAFAPEVVHAATPWYAVGTSHTIVLLKDGTVQALGENGEGQLGNGRFGRQGLEPVKVANLSGVIAVAVGGATSVALKQDGTVWTWGFNGSGQLGNGSTKNSSEPVCVEGLKGITAIATGSSHVMALDQNGVVWAWGNNRLGQLGSNDANNMTSPVRVKQLDGVVSIASGEYHSMALKKDGTVWAWGYNGYGQLGNGSTSAKGTGKPTQVTALNDVKAISAGINHSVALKRDNSLWAWGNNYYGQAGNGATDHAISRPARVNGITGEVIDITAKANHTLALMRDNTVWAWGDNGTGQWGNGIGMSGSTAPVQMQGLNGPTPVTAVVALDSTRLQNAAHATDNNQRSGLETVLSEPVNSQM
jgi:alpha-tubulin suppressor-like RCC1 family protein